MKKTLKHKKIHLPKYRTITNKNLLVNNNNNNTYSNTYSNTHSAKSTHKQSHKNTHKNTHKKTHTNTNMQSNTYITSEVLDDATYTHFKSLINNSPNL